MFSEALDAVSTPLQVGATETPVRMSESPGRPLQTLPADALNAFVHWHQALPVIRGITEIFRRG